jgi:hypothetical protein
MTCYEYYESYYNVENSRFCLFELFFIPSRDEYKPTSVDNKKDTHKHEESIEIRYNLPDNTNSTRDILSSYITGPYRDDIATA